MGEAFVCESLVLRQAVRVEYTFILPTCFAHHFYKIGWQAVRAASKPFADFLGSLNKGVFHNLAFALILRLGWRRRRKADLDEVVGEGAPCGARGEGEVPEFVRGEDFLQVEADLVGPRFFRQFSIHAKKIVGQSQKIKKKVAFRQKKCQDRDMYEKLTGAEIRGWRKANGWTLEKLGDVLGGLPVDAVSRMETGKRAILPAEERLLRILVRRELPPEFLNRMQEGLEPGVIPLAPEQWRIIEALARRGGQTPEGWVAAKVRCYLNEIRAAQAILNDEEPPSYTFSK